MRDITEQQPAEITPTPWQARRNKLGTKTFIDSMTHEQTEVATVWVHSNAEYAIAAVNAAADIGASREWLEAGGLQRLVEMATLCVNAGKSSALPSLVLDNLREALP